MPNQNIYTKTSWIKLTPCKGKKDPFSASIGDLFSEENGGHLIPQSDIESPNKVLKTLWPKFGIGKIKPFCDIRTGANIWEYYLLRMHGCSPDRYEKLRKKPTQTFGNLRKIRLGFTYSAWQSRYGEINNNALKKASSKFITALKKQKGALRQNDGNQEYIDCRKKAAWAFFKYLTSRKTKIINHLSKRESLYELLVNMIKNETNQSKKDHLYCVGAMLCLYGRKDEAKVSCNLAKIVCKKISSLKGCLANEICTELMNASKKFKTDFKPPFANIYGYYQDKATILFRLTTWLTLVEATYNACEED
ncbi:hypothetical protein IKQ19_09485 [Candidatus Saccharibacteria bacterium]|nr:hypothetical protein [Candidatus Saccharibacteria bacterium]